MSESQNTFNRSRRFNDGGRAVGTMTFPPGAHRPARRAFRVCACGWSGWTAAGGRWKACKECYRKRELERLAKKRRGETGVATEQTPWDRCWRSARFRELDAAIEVEEWPKKSAGRWRGAYEPESRFCLQPLSLSPLLGC